MSNNWWKRGTAQREGEREREWKNSGHCLDCGRHAGARAPSSQALVFLPTSSSFLRDQLQSSSILFSCFSPRAQTEQRGWFVFSLALAALASPGVAQCSNLAPSSCILHFAATAVIWTLLKYKILLFVARTSVPTNFLPFLQSSCLLCCLSFLVVCYLH